MSRCFPYPPPGYERSGVRDEALIESIKLQREKEKARKEKKKEKSRERNEKKEARKKTKTENKKQSHEGRHKEKKSQVDHKVADHQKKRKKEGDQLERSVLTEEHGQPLTSKIRSDSSDSTQNSNKRRKNSNGSIIRIRLPLERQKDPEVLPCKEQTSSALGRTDAKIEEKRKGSSALGRADAKVQEKHEGVVPLMHVKESIEPFEIAGPSSLCASESLPVELQYRNLIKNWVPQPLQFEHADLDDQGWLFGTRKNNGCGVKILKSSLDRSTFEGFSLWPPRACYLPEADIYALPYTIPF